MCSHLQMKLSCHAKSIGGAHTLIFIFKSDDNKRNLDLKEHRVFSSNWEKVEFAFSIDTNYLSYLRIDDLNVSKAPNSVQIKDLVLLEKR